MDTTPYPRRTVDAIVAALAGGISGVALALLVVTTLNAVTGNFQTVNTANLNTTSTAAIATAVVQNATIGNLNASSTIITPSLTASSTAVGTSGTRKTGEWATSIVVNVDSLGADQSTSSAFSLTGIAAGDFCFPAASVGDLGQSTSTIVLRAQAGTNAGTIYYRNATSTASMDAGVSTVGVVCKRFQ